MADASIEKLVVVPNIKSDSSRASRKVALFNADDTPYSPGGGSGSSLIVPEFITGSGPQTLTIDESHFGKELIPYNVVDDSPTWTIVLPDATPLPPGTFVLINWFHTLYVDIVYQNSYLGLSITNSDTTDQAISKVCDVGGPIEWVTTPL